MVMDKIVQEWIKISEYDLETADAMLKAGRYLYVVFMCQQTVEKLLKAMYSKIKGELPPRTHNLLYLVDILGLNLAGSDKFVLSQLNQFYLESRYPVERNKLAEEMDESKSVSYLNKTKELWTCLKQKFL